MQGGSKKLIWNDLWGFLSTDKQTLVVFPQLGSNKAWRLAAVLQLMFPLGSLSFLDRFKLISYYPDSE